MSELNALEAAYVLGIAEEKIDVAGTIGLNLAIKGGKKIKSAIGNKVDDNKLKAVFKKAGWNTGNNSPSNLSYSRISEFVENCENVDTLTDADWKIFHAGLYDEAKAIEEFSPSEVGKEIALIKHYQPVPIFAHGNGDHYCITKDLQIKEYIHDVSDIFDHKSAQDFANFKDWYNNWFKKYAV